MNRRRLLKALSGLPLLGAFAGFRPAAEAAPTERSRLMVGVDTGGPDTTVAWLAHPDGRLTSVPEMCESCAYDELRAGIVEGDLVEISVPSHPNCRCVIEPVREEGELSWIEAQKLSEQIEEFVNGQRRAIDAFDGVKRTLPEIREIMVNRYGWDPWGEE